MGLCDPAEWSDYKKEQAKYAIGGSSIEMLMKSYNAWKGNNVLFAKIVNGFDIRLIQEITADMVLVLTHGVWLADLIIYMFHLVMYQLFVFSKLCRGIRSLLSTFNNLAGLGQVNIEKREVAI